MSVHLQESSEYLRLYMGGWERVNLQNGLFVQHFMVYNNIALASQGLVWLEWATEGNQIERVNPVCAHTKRQGRMCQQVSLGPLKRLKFN